VDFSGRKSPLYVHLGSGGPSRRHATQEGASLSPVERFLGNRLHGFTTIVRIEQGRGRIAGSFGSAPVEAGDVVAIPPGLMSYAFEGYRRVETLAIATSIDTGAVIRARELPPDLLSRDDRHVIRALRDAPARAIIRRSDNERVLMSALATIAADPPGARLSSVAATLGYSADGLRALIRRSTGRGFAQWRDALTMAHARSLLANDSAVVDVARSLAIESQYLHRRFARAHGTTPSRWRDAPVLPAHAAAHDWDSLVRSFTREETANR
jgi:AraC-like DNA-binding protein